jgi:hypothetical protein
LQLFPANGKQGPAAMTNNKQDKVNHQIQADTVIKHNGVRINWKKYFFQGRGTLKIEKTCGDPYLNIGLDQPMHFN